MQEGVSLRDYLALNAPPSPDNYEDEFEDDAWRRMTLAEIESRWSYEYADAMLKERVKERT